MKKLLSLIGVYGLVVAMSGCAPKDVEQSKDEQYLQEQEEEQGYPVLIAVPKSADYGLPFCEKQYCLEVEIFSFKSQDKWFNAYVDHKISDLIRKELGLSQKLSLQQAVNEFVRFSDEWQEDNTNQPWSVFIQPRVVLQQNEIAILQVQTEYVLGDRTIEPQHFYEVLDRKAKQPVRLYDIVKEESRLQFGQFLQQYYQQWLSEQSSTAGFPEKIYWASQDWFIDEDGIAIYYRVKDLNPKASGENLTIYLSKADTEAWIKSKYSQPLLFN